MKFKSNEEGKCPICNSENLEYFGMELEDTAVYFPWHCPDCDTDGKEWYYVNFSEVRSNDDKIGNEEGICPDCGAEIEYGTAEPDGSSLGYEYFCPECENSGVEWYDLDFDSHTINGHEGETIELEEDLTKNYGGQNLEKPVDEVKKAFKNLVDTYNTQAKLKVERNGEQNDLEYINKTVSKSGHKAFMVKFQLDEIGGLLTGGYKIIYRGIFIDTKSMETEDYAYGQITYKLDDKNNLMEPVQEYDDINEFIEKINNINVDELITEAIDYKNDRYNATTAEDPEDDRAYYGKNMTKRDKVRSLDQAKRNLDRMEKDPRVTQGQAVDQLSFDDKALDTNLSRYKKNKEDAKKSAEKGNDFWADEHNKTAKQFADRIRAKHKKQEDINDDEEENDIDFDDTISLLDMALSEIPTVGVEDWGKDDELLFTADTKVMFENLKNYEEEIPRYYYDNASNDDWSNGIDSYLEEIKGVNLNDGDSDNTYNWNAPLTHDVEFTMYEADDGCYFKGSIHRTGDVRGNYTTEFLLKFNDKDDCLETLFDTCSENCYRQVTVDGVDYTVSPHFFNEYVDIWSSETQENYDDVYCDCIERLKEIIAENKEDEIVEENFKGKKEEVSSGYAEFLYNQQKANNFKNEQDEIKRAQKIAMLQDKIDHRRDSLADLGLRYFADDNVHKIFTLADNKLYDKCTINESDVLEKLNKIDAFLSEIINKRKAEGTTE